MTETRGDYQTPAREPEPMSEERLAQIAKWVNQTLIEGEESCREEQMIACLIELLAEVHRLRGLEQRADALLKAAMACHIQCPRITDLGYSAHLEMQQAIGAYKEVQR